MSCEGGYFSKVKVKEYAKDAPYTEREYKKAFKTIYRSLRKYKGEELYNFLNDRMNFDAYLKWLAINTAIMNGDYSDEVFFYAIPGEKIYFELMPWDMDDLFKPPHDGPWNNFFFKRRLKKSLLYSMEDKLDRRIDKDPFLYAKFKQTLKKVLEEELTAEFYASVINTVHQAIEPYLTSKNMELSEIDDRDTKYDSQYILDLLNNRFKQLKQRRQKLLEKLK